MSMIGNFRMVDDQEVEALLEVPERIEKLLYGEPVAPKKKGILSWFSRKETPEEDSWSPNPDNESMDVEKAWHGIHYLLSGSPWKGKGPLSFVLRGGTDIGSVDLGYGPARAFKSGEVNEIAQALENIQVDDLKEKCDPEDFTAKEIYPEIWDEDFEECFDYVLEYFEQMREFVLKAAHDGKGLLVYIN